MTTCTKCIGEGLIGSGEKPELKQGAVKTCDLCNGTGILVDGQVSVAMGKEATVPEGSLPENDTVEPEIKADEALASNETTPEVSAEADTQADQEAVDGSTIEDAPEVA